MRRGTNLYRKEKVQNLHWFIYISESNSFEGSKFIEASKADDEYGNGNVNNTNTLEDSDISDVDSLQEAEGSGDIDGSGKLLTLIPA